MHVAQILINALVLGCLYTCIAIGSSLVWGVLNVINLIHGSFIVLGAYLAFGLHYSLHLSPWYAVVVAAPLFFMLGYLLQWLLLNRVTTAPVLVTLTLTFGLDLILNNAIIYYFKADYRKLTLAPPLGSVSILGVVVAASSMPARSHQNLAASSARRRWALSRAARIGSAGPVVGPIGTKRTLLMPMKRSASRK